MATCPVCSLVAEPSFSVIPEICKHMYHVDCAPGGDIVNYDYCPSCVDTKKNHSSSYLSEPHTTDGIDYVIHPGSKKKPSVIMSGLSSGLSSVVGLIRKQQPPTAVAEPVLDLLRKRIPIKTIMSKYGYGLDHMLRDGIDIDDFLSNGYKLDDLMMFEYISQEGPTRALQTLTNGLNLTATHLKLYPDRIPIDKFRNLTQISNGQFNTELGLYFKEDGPLCCDGIDHQWSARDCVKLGLTMEDLISFGLVWIEQYQDLMTGLTEREQLQAEKALKVNVKQLQSLRSIEEEEKLQLKAEYERQRQMLQEQQLVEEEGEPPYVEEEAPTQLEEPYYEELGEAHFQEEEQQPVWEPERAPQRVPQRVPVRAPTHKKQQPSTVFIPPEIKSKTKGQPSPIKSAVLQSDGVEHVPASYLRHRQMQQQKSKSPLIVYK